MNTNNQDRIHAILDGEVDAGGCTPEEIATLARHRTVLERFANSRVCAPEDLMPRILAALPAAHRLSFREWLWSLLPQRRQWVIPAFASALATTLVMLGFWHPAPPPPKDRVLVHFQIHAPGAQRVELLGDFNHWTPGLIRLHGPDASGHWTANVELPEGHYGYQFLVDGNTWVTDPAASVHRPDGFGREDAMVDVYKDRS